LLNGLCLGVVGKFGFMDQAPLANASARQRRADYFHTGPLIR
jgi:hypothetical protein